MTKSRYFYLTIFYIIKNVIFIDLLIFYYFILYKKMEGIYKIISGMIIILFLLFVGHLLEEDIQEDSLNNLVQLVAAFACV